MTTALRPLVVIISNDRGFTHLLRTLLQDLDVIVRTSRASADALSVIEQTHPQLVILDLVPSHETTSWLILEAMKVRPPIRDTPILVCPVAAWMADEHAHRLAQLGVQTWSNEFDLGDLLEKVRGALERALT